MPDMDASVLNVAGKVVVIRFHGQRMDQRRIDAIVSRTREATGAATVICVTDNIEISALSEDDMRAAGWVRADA